MENDILDALQGIGYEGPMLNKKNLLNAINGGPKNLDYTTLISTLTEEIKSLCELDESVHQIKTPEDSSTFLLELSSFLKECGCPYVSLTQGHVTDRLHTAQDKQLLLHYLLTELMASRMCNTNKAPQTMELKIQESDQASDLKHILLALKFNKPPPNINPAVLFQKVGPKLEETARRAGPQLKGQPLFKHRLSQQEWDKLGGVNADLEQDYKIRREMLLKRLDCTIQSFNWSERMKGKEDRVVQIYTNKRKHMQIDPQVDLSDLLAARTDLAIIEKTSNASVRKNTKTALNKHIIGPVPDRGGRPSEQAPPPPEMPSWQQRSAPQRGGRGGGGGGGPNNFSRPQNQQTSSYDSNNQSGDRHSGDSFRGRSNYNRGNQHQDNSRGSQNYDSRGFDNRGSGYNDNRGSGYNDNRGGFRGGYNNYQVNKTSYAEQYVQDNAGNQQYRGGDGYRGRGGRGYNRGGYR